MLINRRIAAVVLVTSLVVLGGCGSDQGGNGEPVPEWLFSLQATGVTTYDSETKQLVMPVESVLAFTDRPDRISRVEDPQVLADLWNRVGGDSFSADPPNIVLTWWPTNGGYSDSMRAASIVGDVSYDSDTSLMSMTLANDGGDSLDFPAAMVQVSMFVDKQSCPDGCLP
jgi:hypothetical protein